MSAKENVVITRYHINRCGYYFPNRHEDKAHAFGQAAGIFKNLATWVNGKKSLLETQTFAKTVEMLPTFMLDMAEHKEEYLLCAWNESQSVNGQLLMVKATEPVGTHNVTATKLTKGDIPGYPSYFWIRPKKKEYLTVQFADGGLNGREGFVKYMEAYMERFDPIHVNANYQIGLSADWHKNLNGYQEDSGKKLYELNHVDAQFRSNMARSPGKVSEIRSHLEDVYKVIKKASLVTTQPGGASLLKNFLSSLGISDTSVNSNIEYRVHQSFNYKPTLKQFNEIVKKWEEENEEYDVGFHIKGSTSPFWLSNSINRTKLEEVPVKKTGDFSIDCKALLKELQNRNHLIL